MNVIWSYAQSAVLVSISAVAAAAPPNQHPGCDERTAMQCVDLALGAMGGRTVFAMHQGPTPWESVMAQVQKARQG